MVEGSWAARDPTAASTPAYVSIRIPIIASLPPKAGRTISDVKTHQAKLCSMPL